MFEELKQAWARSHIRRLEKRIRKHGAERAALRSRHLERVAKYEAAVAALAPGGAGKTVSPPTVNLKAKN